MRGSCADLGIQPPFYTTRIFNHDTNSKFPLYSWRIHALPVDLRLDPAVPYRYPSQTGTDHILGPGPYPTFRVMPCSRPGTRICGGYPGTRYFFERFLFIFSGTKSSVGVENSATPLIPRRQDLIFQCARSLPVGVCNSRGKTTEIPGCWSTVSRTEDRSARCPTRCWR